MLFNTLLLTLPAIGNISAILGLMFLIYSIIGVQLFSKVKDGVVINDVVNFRDFFSAFLTLIRCVTGENWNQLMYDCLNQDSCTVNPTYNSSYCVHNFNNTNCIPFTGCGNNFAYPYFYSFMIIINFILINLFIGVVLDSFDTLTRKVELPQQYFEEFIRVWNCIYIYIYLYLY